MFQTKLPTNLGFNISLIDDLDLGLEQRTGTYVIHDKALTIVETSASPSIPYILEGLKHLNINPQEIHYIIVTHIHLDHAGGAGILLKECPNAKIVVHPRGARHLIDPSKLIDGARAVYGEKFDELFNPILPIPEDRLIIKYDNESIQLAERTLTFYDTPGHAKHHFSIHDSLSNGIFTGDTVGVYYQDLKEIKVSLFLPSTSPNQFNPDSMIESTERIRSLGVDRIFFGHYGMYDDPQEVFSQVKQWLTVFLEIAELEYKKLKTPNIEMLTDRISTQLFLRVKNALSEQTVPDDHKVYNILKIDMEVCAMGLADFLLRKN
ncbi:MBL fold metallo-hydrolase [Bacillus sp. Marseille-P3661]|uniref:MBL fold metallo-hydrolase n=1 Tax=Bacillus sp. Marseille-P3661 TaxID=1936234 RepID=UPI000C85FE78|nr:MBL fold metallo-hydrolase [Bacillus sp. Marseille-P3661]